MHKKTRFFKDLTVQRVKLFNMMKTENVLGEGRIQILKAGKKKKIPECFQLEDCLKVADTLNIN